MEATLRPHVLAHLAADPVLAAGINHFSEEVPRTRALPWIGIVASASQDWSTKDRTGREVRIAIELHCRTDDAQIPAALSGRIEAIMPQLPDPASGFTIAAIQSLRARSEQRSASERAILIEYRFRLLAV